MKMNFSMWVNCLALIGLMVARSEAKPPVWSAQPDREITISMVPAKMAYDTTLLRVRPGAKLRLTLKNPDVCRDPWMWHLLAIDGKGELLHHQKIYGKALRSNGTVSCSVQVHGKYV